MREGGTRSLPRRRPGRAIPAPELQPRPGMRLGRYELLLELGRGGMAVVWAARMVGELGFSRVVALKTILPEYADDPSFRRGMFEEARIAARLRHANVVEVLELAEEGPLLYQVMTLIEGDSLAGLIAPDPSEGLRVAPIPPPVAARVLSDVLAGLHAAHEVTDDNGVSLNLVHRDVSPQNVLVGIDGVARLTDFGVAKALGRIAEETQMGQIRGKPGYLSPEQQARQVLDRRCDVYAAGIVLWESLAGRRLFQTSDAGPPAARPADAQLPDPRRFVPDIPEPLVEVTFKALAQDRDRRYRTALDMRDAIDLASREAGIVAMAKDVATYVAERRGASIEQRRAQIRALIRKESEVHSPLSRSVPPPLPASSAGASSDRTVDLPVPQRVADLAAALRQGAVGLPHDLRDLEEPTTVLPNQGAPNQGVPNQRVPNAATEEMPPVPRSAPPPVRGVWIAGLGLGIMLLVLLAMLMRSGSPDPSPGATADPVELAEPEPPLPAPMGGVRAPPSDPPAAVNDLAPEASEPASPEAKRRAVRRAREPKKRPKPMFSNPYK
ncbi:MAG: serine/threonine protein kinase [Deltaproteobacteria bacterium]|nr:serine/threonine protein kinase [Deltaproteobacteria bacterium]